METSKLKKFAADARINLMDGVRRKLRLLGFDEKDRVIGKEPELIEGGTLWNEEEYPVTFYQQWTALRDRLSERGVREVVEEAAYTWFNRMMAIRILTMNGLCEPVLRFDPATGLPLLLADARMGRVPEMSAQERVRFDKLMDDDNRTYDQFALLLTVWCHANPIISSCFGSIHDYVELLLPDNILRPDGFLAKLNDTPFITEEDYKSAELIGWLYQFYISDRKDEVFAKKGKVEAEEIPAATQIFTPNWIVKYMVENTILPQVEADDEIIENAKYLVGTHGSCVRSRMVELEDLKVADFACGSGHILNECFDLLFLLYRAESYSRREAIECIFTENLTGIDIDLRAKQLATFALLLKACQKDSSFADAHCMPHVITVPEMTAILKTSKYEDEDGGHGKAIKYDFFQNSVTHEIAVELEKALALVKDADSLGSIIKFDLSSSALRAIKETAEYWRGKEAIERPEFVNDLLPAIDFILTLSDSYDAIVMNPPYMGANKMDSILAEYVKGTYSESSADLMTVFMDVAIYRTTESGYWSMINLPSWMFLNSFEEFRYRIIRDIQIISFNHNGRGVFGSDFGSVSFVCQNTSPYKKGCYRKLYEEHVQVRKNETIEQLYLNTSYGLYCADQRNFLKIPQTPISYWVNENFFNPIDQCPKLGEIAQPRAGLQTSDNNRFLRYWHEVSFIEIGLNLEREIALKSAFKWFPHNKGGAAREWYGNRDLVINFANDGEELKYWLEHNPKDPTTKSWSRNLRNYPLYFHEALTWSAVGSGRLTVRYSPTGSLFDTSGPILVADSKELLLYILGLTNTVVFDKYLSIFAQGISKGSGHFSNVPFKFESNLSYDIVRLVNSNIEISKSDWDAHETSWDFQQSPLLVAMHDCRGNVADLDMLDEDEQEEIKSLVPNVYNSAVLEECVNCYKSKWERLFFKLHANEEALNRQFIEVYGLEDELSPDVPLNEITILQQGEISINEDSEVRSYPEGDKEIMYKESPISFNLDVIIKQLISYIVGVWMGRYRLDRPGLHIAHPNPTDEELSKYQIPNSKYQFEIDSDGIIPVLPQGAPFYDNLYNYVEQFVKMVWGETHLQENMNFIEKCLGKPLNDFLMKDFWKYHKKMYQNRPIYWEFASKKGAFRALVYAHRMDRFTVEVLRSKYLLPYIAHIEKKVANMEARAADLSTPERRDLDTLRDKTLPELREYADRVEVVALKNITFDLDDGIIKNHALFGDIVTKLK